MIKRVLPVWPFFLLVSIQLLAGCTVVNPLPMRDAAVKQVWPALPATPRVELLRVFGGAKSLVDQDTQKGRIYRWLTGDMADQLPLVAPYGVATDGQGRLWVSDPGAKVVHAFDFNQRSAALWRVAGDRFLQGPSGVAYDAKSQRVYVADSVAKKVFIFAASGKYLGELAGPEPFARPGGLAVNKQGRVYVADVLAGQVRRFSPAGKELEPFGSPTTPDGRFNRPTALTIDKQGRLYVVDSLNFRVEVLSPTGDAIASIGKLGDAPGSFSRPRGVAVDSFGHIYVSDAAFDNIQVFNLKGQLLLIFGGGGKNGLSMPANMTTDGRDRIYVVDSFNHRVMIYRFLGRVD